MLSITADNVERFLAEDDGRPIVMLNLLRFKPEGGRGRYMDYITLVHPLVLRYGGDVLFAGDGANAVVAEPGQAWDAVALVRYPSRRAFTDMIADADYAIADPVRKAGLEEAVLQPLYSMV